MSAVCTPQCTPLAQHSKLPNVVRELPALTRKLYGREWPVLEVGLDRFKLSFEEVHAEQAGMQLRVRCGAKEYEIQVLEPSSVADFEGALSPSVPVALQRAAVQYVLTPLWQALELRFQMPMELADLQACVPAWPASQALGVRVSRHGPQGIQQTLLLIRADSSEAWHQLACASLMPSPASLAMDALALQVCAHSEPIALTLHELSELEVGDVLVMDATARQRDRLPVRLMLHGRLLGGVSGLLGSTQLVIAHASAKASARVSELARSSPFPNISNIPNPMMKNESTTAAASAPQLTPSLDSVKVDIELELARMTVPLSSLRTLSVGQVFETVHPINGQNVVLWCGGQRLGVGGLVAVGDRLGVRVLALEPGVGLVASASD